MSMFPHTVTVYNVKSTIDLSTFVSTLTTHITILRGVLLDATKADNVRTSGLVSADAVTLYIPRDVTAIDPETGRERQFIGAQKFERLEDKTDYWTLSVSGESGLTFFVKGEVVMPDSAEDIVKSMVDDVYTVTKIDEKDYGGLQHWEVGGA